LKLVKIILGTVFALATLCYAVQFAATLLRSVRVWTTVGYSPQGLSQTGGAAAALAIGTAFTVWTFRSAFRRTVSAQTADDDRNTTAGDA
jgi:hypothetical protein